MGRIVNDISTHRVSWYKAEKGRLTEEGLKWGGKGWNPEAGDVYVRRGMECQHAHTSGDKGTERSLEQSLISK